MAVFSLLFMLFSAIVPILGAVGLIYFIKYLTSQKPIEKTTEEDGEDMLKNIYTYLVLFATLMMSIGGSVGVFMGVANYVIPQPYIETYDNYRMTYSGGNDSYDYNNAGIGVVEAEEGKVRSDYELMKKDAEETEQRSALKLIIQSVGWIVIPLPVFMYFQRQLKETKSTKE